MRKYTLPVWLLAGATTLSAPPTTRGDIVLTYDLNQARLTYTAASMHMNVTETNTSTFVLDKEDSITNAVMDSAIIFGGSNFNTLLSLTGTDLPGANNWSFGGTFAFTDLNTATNAGEANFTSSSVTLLNGTLFITGALTPMSGNTILVNRGSPWTFDGQFGDGFNPDEDGIDGNLFIGNEGSFSNGTLVTLKFGIDDGLALDALFGADRDLFNGNVKGSIVPVPGAVWLAAVGLGVIGVCKRKT